MADYRNKEFKNRCISCAYLSEDPMGEDFQEYARKHVLNDEMGKPEHEGTIWNFTNLYCHKRLLEDMFRELRGSRSPSYIQTKLKTAKCPGKLPWKAWRPYQQSVTPNEALETEHRQNTLFWAKFAVIGVFVSIILTIVLRFASCNNIPS